MRLAYEQGLLRQPSVNRYQRWALTYMLSWIRWDHEAKEESFIKHTLAVNDWDRYVVLFAPELTYPDEEDSLPISPDEFRDIDQWFRDAEKMRVTTAADLFPVQGPEDGWR